MLATRRESGAVAKAASKRAGVMTRGSLAWSVVEGVESMVRSGVVVDGVFYRHPPMGALFHPSSLAHKPSGKDGSLRKE